MSQRSFLRIVYESSQRSRNTAGAAWQPIVTLASPTTCPTCSHPTWRPQTSGRAVQRREHVFHWKSFLLSNRIERKLRGVHTCEFTFMFYGLHALQIASSQTSQLRLRIKLNPANKACATHLSNYCSCRRTEKTTFIKVLYIYGFFNIDIFFLCNSIEPKLTALRAQHHS